MDEAELSQTRPARFRGLKAPVGLYSGLILKACAFWLPGQFCGLHPSHQKGVHSISRLEFRITS
jgi:hypothetical protein